MLSHHLISITSKKKTDRLFIEKQKNLSVLGDMIGDMLVAWLRGMLAEMLGLGKRRNKGKGHMLSKEY